MPSDFLQSHPRRVGVHRHVTRAGFHDGEHARNRVRGFVQIKPNTVPGPHPLRDQRVGQLVGQALEFAVGDALIAQPNGFVIRLPGGAFRKEVM